MYRISIKSLIFLMLLFSWLIGCAKEVVLPPVEPWPSKVVTSDGMGYFVYNLRIPGTKQAVKMREGGAITWIPLADIANIRFTGPVCDQYRPARIFLLRGGRLEGELFVDFIIEGTSDQGYWNIPMSKVEAVDIGSD
ncbi:hypothetical protein [Desulfobacca acetoxidans]|uniref:Lipoprotein n=1 Tax=Desulfobacca acetoxidans (strain ATCC 700848 / DSM 11109 / ASRB2) TaxID=880072 RepID=F2NGR6_DESAR|nr:hypothetical protein [Desulfobacca acetoxidans]AEB08687.1 hypothetical protein Desac_0808 [Desulfobacca acetoxidans DSM 11109]